jgi:hypothetical protein
MRTHTFNPSAQRLVRGCWPQPTHDLTAGRQLQDAHTCCVRCRLQQQARQDRVQARTSNISLGDSRLHSHDTSYRINYAAPLPGTDMLRSPLQACYYPLQLAVRGCTTC